MPKAKPDNSAQTPLVEAIKLPVGILIDDTRHKEVELRPITLGESYEASFKARETDLQALVDLACMTHVPALGRCLSYDELAGCSRQDGREIEQARMRLEKKEQRQATTSA
ncbi:hypothetical protein [Psychrobacter pygoscelis]|uniref:hypothetical protein n=1 Tax=Psychrobacter pygoscelis TaxID=2488563 RepID=UPI001040875D|nr:hypothetical protein [Psychrobacter pygoscelis]